MKCFFHAINRIQLVTADVPLKEIIWIRWHTLPCVDGGDCPIWKLQAPFDVDFVSRVDWVVVFIWRSKHIAQFVVCA